ncbi:unnamed protein product [Ceratitis capitata]|uniref:(Mediterranean fruit fly) hypothetical protein n=1 Tax=Ceratitis capitata TaxID=7213 RepID=A0A811VIP6_CERCA|nr:unnamed protein product [Ceratitis capitata]
MRSSDSPLDLRVNKRPRIQLEEVKPENTNAVDETTRAVVSLSPPITPPFTMPTEPPQPTSSEFVIIGKNGTTVKRADFEKINFRDFSKATRILLKLIFTLEILASHTLSGNPAPLPKDAKPKPQKRQLDPEKISDLIECVVRESSAAVKLIKSTITMACADATKKCIRKKIPINYLPAVADENVTQHISQSSMELELKTVKLN